MTPQEVWLPWRSHLSLRTLAAAMAAMAAAAMAAKVTLASEAGHIARATIESLAYQTRDNVQQLATGGRDISVLRVDGGASSNNLLCQFQADILGITVARPEGLERTVLGIAHLAGSYVGLWEVGAISARWTLERTFEPLMSADERESLYAGWREAVAAARSLPARE